MNLKYNILWFEDDPDVVENQVGPEIKAHLEQLGFEYLCMHKEEGKNLDIITDDKKFDLILTDLNLEEEEIGKKIIDQIRADRIYTEVILYSQNANAINKIITDPDRLIERVSFAVGTDNLANRAIRIIDLTLKKVQDVTNMRGLVIAAAIDLEVEMEEIIKFFFKIVGNDTIDKKRIEILKDMHSNKVQRDARYLENIKKIDHSNIDLLLEEGILTASNIYDALMSAIKIFDREYGFQLNGLKDKIKRQDINTKKTNLKVLKDNLGNFQKDIISIRNTLAHAKEELGGDGIPFLKNRKVGGDIIVFNDQKYIEIRRNFLQYSKTIIDIKNLLCP